MRRYTDAEKIAIYERWAEHQAAEGCFVPLYPWQAYADSAYEIWEGILTNRKFGAKRIWARKDNARYAVSCQSK